MVLRKRALFLAKPRKVRCEQRTLQHKENSAARLAPECIRIWLE